MDAKMQWVESVWNRMREHLQNKKSHIVAEIRNYPTPIAGCDQQFNYLLEQRTALANECARLQKAAGESLTAEDPIRSLHEFIQTSTCLDDEIKASIAESTLVR